MNPWNPDTLRIWNKLTQPALKRAGEALSHLTAQPVELTGVGTRTVAWPELESKIHLENPERDPVYATHLGAFGLFPADILLVFTQADAARLLAVLTGSPPSEPFELDELGSSALAEVGNILGTAFLNVFADTFQQPWEPTPPEVTVGPFAEVVARIFPHWKPQDAVLLSEALLRVGPAVMEGYLVVVPRPWRDGSSSAAEKGAPQ
ncbi:MAG: chemotaxis protein CheC [Firmicutes bacterium]|nr:chemotaxis protein CheC [Alicyclobacillaceae bacterium]MCL6496311.1 chemotaxis protein CheC [Bacillota bacterium]